ncbi:MAG TPA: molybdopterin-synthase adenylyltransferase MoeB [Bacteroidota bacterium]|nr:molybdopterin-synthase adenylyltransferase MoeB [Bacteroidota bacterium]
MPEFSSDELNRYSRHLILPEVGLEGQCRLRNASVLVVGAGGLGAPASLYLCAAGIGHLGLIDSDAVELSNLQRQILYGTQDIGRPKILAARERLLAMNPQIDITPYHTRLSSANAMEILSAYDVVVDCSDNFQTRYLINDVCVLLGKAHVYGSIYRFEGQASVFRSGDGSACYRCLYSRPPAPELAGSCAEAGVLGVLPGIIGSIQATETLKIILGGGELLTNRLLIVDAWTMHIQEVAFAKDPSCPVCGTHPSINTLIDYETFCNRQASSSAVEQETASAVTEISASQLDEWIDERSADIQIIDVREPLEYAQKHIPRSILIPFDELLARRAEIDPLRTTVMVCTIGVRSARAIALLRHAGFAGRLVNLRGGITAWMKASDPGAPVQ